ncbi:MAG: GNAT family N-acetyltransferase [Oscillospiraceae bacterium]|jgi:ribosomal protein S18 acetylase RimI-like enzyme|nr:GNAT family N-acetyltransferase [Oscillospiraceae bacterium]
MIALTPSVPADLPVLEDLYAQSLEYFSFDSGKLPAPPGECMKKGDLPPGGARESYTLYNVLQDGAVVGYVAYYKGYPDGATAYITFTFISERGRGIGGVAISLVLNALRSTGFRRARCSVSLKNPAALRFWHKMGFAHITMVDIEEDYAGLELETIL